jgi:hypothetical protein
MHVSGIRFPLRSLNSRAKSNLYLLAGPQGRSVFGSKEKNHFPCRQLSPGCSWCIHDEVTISNHKTIHYWIFLNQTTLCAIHYVTFTAHHEGSDDRERPWQWPVYRITSCSSRGLGKRGPPVPSRLLQIVFLLFAMYYIAKILPRAARCPIVLGSTVHWQQAGSPDKRCRGRLATSCIQTSVAALPWPRAAI